MSFEEILFHGSLAVTALVTAVLSVADRLVQIGDTIEMKVDVQVPAIWFSISGVICIYACFSAFGAYVWSASRIKLFLLTSTFTNASVSQQDSHSIPAYYGASQCSFILIL